jgi:drug/metabolite transporter (DMT)-like permease
MTPTRKAILALITANVIWGCAAPIFKLSLDNIPLFTLAFWRFFLGAAILLTIFGPAVARSGNLLKHHPRELLLYSLCGITFNIIFFFLGLKLTRAVNAPVIAASAPIIIAVLAWVILKERLSLRKLTGILMGFSGIVAIIVEPIVTQGFDASFLGNIFLTLATMGAVGQALIGRKILKLYDPIMFTYWSFVIGAMTFLPLALYEAVSTPDLYRSLDWRGYLGIAFGSVLSSAAAYTLFDWGLSKIAAADAALFAYIDPVVGAILAYFMLGEPITPPLVVGGLLIFGGIFVAEGRIHYHPVHRIFRNPK